MKCLVTLDDTNDLQQSDKRQLGQNMLAKEEYLRLTWRAAKMDNKIS